jgi:hypothetical protein
VVVEAAVREEAEGPAMATATLMTVAEATAVAMTMDLAAPATTIAAMADPAVAVVDTAARVATSTALEASTAMHQTAAMLAGTADATTVVVAEVVAEVEAATTTAPLQQLLAPVVTIVHPLHVRRTAEVARTRVITTAHTASPPADHVF